jgi:Ca2+-binding RTX toxin-like protein
MRRRRRPPKALLAVVALTLWLGVAITATNVVPATRAGAPTGGAPTANQLKPAACAALNLSTVRVVSGTFTGTGAAELIIGSPGVDTLRGAGRDDCILGGDGNDSLRGDGGTDVCIGGAGTDTFHATCETQIQ